MPQGNHFQWAGKNLRQLHWDYRRKILELLIQKGKPMSITDVSDETSISIPTTTLILHELALEGKLNYTVIGNAKVFSANVKSVVEQLEVKEG
jgi:Mn-dependent DtxR family transcriptional regulator